MLEAVCNHTPNVIIVDEISTKQVLSARACVPRVCVVVRPLGRISVDYYDLQLSRLECWSMRVLLLLKTKVPPLLLSGGGHGQDRRAERRQRHCHG